MKKTSYKEILNWSLSFVAIFIAINGIIGILDIWGISDKIPAIILGLIGILNINSILERKNELNNLSAKADKIISLTSADNLKKLDHITNDIPPLLSHIFKDYIEDYRNFFQNAINNQEIEFSDLTRFKSSYIRTLKHKQAKGTTFFATSLPYERYFWLNNEDITPMIKAMSNFVNSPNGKFERIFFIEKNDLQNEEVIKVLDKQIELGILTYTIPIEKVPGDLQQYFVVDGQDELAWEVTIDTKQRINKTKFTTSESKIKKFKSIYKSLKELDEIKEYKSSR